jgi:uncharacterized protein YcfJ
MSYTQMSKEELNKDNLINDVDFIYDAKQFLYDREDYQSEDNEDIYDRYLEHFRYQNVNEVSAVRDMYLAQDYERKGDDEGLARMGRLMSTFENQDTEFTSETVTDYLGGVFTAPSTYASMFSFGAGKAGALAAQQGIKFGIKEIIKGGAKAAGSKMSTKALQKGSEKLGRLTTAKNAFIGGGYKTAIGAGTVDALGGAGTIAAQEQTRVVTNQKDEIDYGNIAIGGVIAGLPGGVLGAGTGSRKAFVENVAGQFTAKEVQKRSNSINHVYKTVSSPKFGKGKDLKSRVAQASVGVLKKSLDETLGSFNMNVGKKLKLDNAPEKGTLLSLDEKILRNIGSAASEIVDKIEPRVKFVDGKDVKIVKGSKEDLEERITSRIARGISSGMVSTDGFMGILKAHNLSATEFGALYAAEMSQAGRTLQTASVISKSQSKKLFEELTDLDKALVTLGETTEAARNVVMQRTDKGLALNKAGDFFRALNKTRIGMMTIQAATTVRNTTNGYMRNYVYALDNLGAGAYNVGYGLLKRNSSDAELRKAAEFAVKEGTAQLRAGGQSLLLKDMVFGLQGIDTAILTKVFKDPKLGNSDIAKQLFRELGDIGVAVGKDSGNMLNTARFFNTFNTLSDNVFKSAIFSREIDKLIKTDAGDVFAKKGINGLSDLVSSGNFKIMDDKALSGAMEKALDFTYQTGKFRGKEGIFNSAAATFIDASSSQLGSAFVPFPRYIVNQFRFVYEHAPILGTFDMLGILNKSNSAERFGKQVTGLAMIGAFYGMRTTLGDETTGAYEYKNPFGHGTFDARASLGPFMAYAFVADYLFRKGRPGGEIEQLTGTALHDNDKVSGTIKTREITEALSGGLSRAGTGLQFVDGIVGLFVGENALEGNKAEEAATKFIANYFSTYTVGAGMIKDAVQLVDPDTRLLTDNTDVEFLPYFLKQATRSFPMEANADGDGFFDRPAQTTPYRTTGIRNTMPMFRQITGLTPVEKKTTAQEELDRFRLDYFEVAPVKVQDNIANREARQMVANGIESHLTDLINSAEYNGLANDYEKEKILRIELGSIRSEAVAAALDEKDYDTPVDIIRKEKARFFKLSNMDRRIIIEGFKKQFPEVTIEDDDYGMLMQFGVDYGIVNR